MSWIVIKLWLKKMALPIAALLGLLSMFLSRRNHGSKATENAREELQEALLREIDERKRREEVEADAELAEKRSGSRADRVAGALKRASERIGRR